MFHVRSSPATLNGIRYRFVQAAHMRSYLLNIIFAAFLSTPAFAQDTTPTVAPAAAAPGKDVVHALNNAFAQVFETVAPAVVIVEVEKKNDGSEGFNFEDLFRGQQGQPGLPGQPNAS